MTETDLQKIRKRTQFGKVFFYHKHLFPIPKITFSSIFPLLKEGSSELSPIPILVYDILIFYIVPYSSFMSLSLPAVPSFAEVKPDS